MVLPVNHVVDGQDVVFRVDAKAEIQRLSRRDLHPWLTAIQRAFWIRIRPTSVSGRQTPGTG